jgi:hypothetical protein
VAIALYQSDLSRVPFLTVQMLINNGIEHCVLHALSAHLGLRLGQDETAARSMRRLVDLVANDDTGPRKNVRDLIEPSFPRDVIIAAHSGNHALTRSLTELWAVAVPETERRFATPPTDRQRDIARFRVPAESRLIELRSPPTGMPRPARRAVIGIRHLWIPVQPASREHDMPARVASALEAYGWQSLRHDLHDLEDPALVADDYAAIAALCRESEADLLILDEFQPNRAGRAAGEIIRALRRERPQLKIVGLYMDPWVKEQWDGIEAGADCLDCAWSLVVTAFWQRPAFAGKTLSMPFPHGGEYPPAPALQPSFVFGGGVQCSNWDRALWLGALDKAQLPLRIAVSTHENDKLEPLASYRAYMRQMMTGEAILNFARRSNGMHTLTGRTFETLATAGLLVQERSDDIDRFFIANRHYLRFETITDLLDIAHLLQTEPDLAEDIRQTGAKFFRDRFADERLIGYLDYQLFHRAANERAAA